MGVEQLAKYFMPGFEVWGRTVTDGPWGPEESYAKLGEIDGKMNYLTGKEQLAGDREMILADHVFFCDSASWEALAGVSMSGSFEIKNENGEVYDVEFPENLDGRMMQVFCKFRR